MPFDTMSSNTNAKVKVINRLDNLELSYVNSKNLHDSSNKHYHEGVSFAVVTNGAGEFKFRNESFKVKKGAIIKIAPGEIHTSGKSIADDLLEYRVFYVSLGLIKTILNREDHKMMNDVFFTKNVSYDQSFYKNCLLSHYNLFSSQDILTQESLISMLVIDLIKKESLSHNFGMFEEKSRPNYLKVLLEYLNVNFKRQVSLNELSIVAKKSPSQILRTFKKYMGISPHLYLINLKIVEAKKLLSEENSVAQVAYELGFTDQSHFHRFFKKFNHTTPAAFKKAISY